MPQATSQESVACQLTGASQRDTTSIQPGALPTLAHGIGAMTIEAFFLPVAGGQRFCMFHSVDKIGRTPRLGQVVFVHALAEEMNRSRRMAALQARALARAGFDVLQIDLLGCGDSSGEFGDATWSAWINDIVQACQWLRAQPTSTGGAGATRGKLPPLWLWGLRAGCLLAADAARQLPEPCNFLFWAPPPAGRPLLQQFLRLKVAGDMLTGNSKGAMEGLRHQLAAGEAVEVAGYALNPALARGLELANLNPPEAALRLEWLELSTRSDAALTPVAAQALARWHQAGYTVRSHQVTGPSFWQTAEIEDAPALITATVAAMTD